MNGETEMKPSQSISAENIDAAYDKLHTEHKALALDLKLLNVAFEDKKRLLESCETALNERDGRVETLETEKAALTQALEGMLNIRQQMGRVNFEEQQTIDGDAHKAAKQVLGTLEA